MQAEETSLYFYTMPPGDGCNAITVSVKLLQKEKCLEKVYSYSDKEAAVTQAGRGGHLLIICGLHSYFNLHGQV